MASKPTKLDELIAEAIGSKKQLDWLEQNRKLTADAFLAEAIALADTSRDKVEKLGVDLETKLGTDYANAFVSKMVRVFREPNYPRCPHDPGKVLNAYGSNEAFQELTGLGATVAQAIAVAVMRVHKRYGDDAFGTIKNWDKYEKESTELRTHIATIYDQMKDAVCGLDLDMSQEDLLSEEIARGLLRVTFKRSPNISPIAGDWPTQIIADAMAPPFRSPKRERAKLRAEKAA